MLETKVIDALINTLSENDIKAMLKRKQALKANPMTEEQKAYNYYFKLVTSKMYPPQYK